MAGRNGTDVTLLEVHRSVASLTQVVEQLAQSVNQAATNVNALTTEIRVDHRRLLRHEDRIRNAGRRLSGRKD
ncbi:MAG: hypothetical protein HYV07_20895 [Deltaproteobacteria bacterium]|nr:hypothetical protein [Deltaproteobacteria bacterium]